MHKSLVTLVVFGAFVSPAAAQTAPQPQAPAIAAPPATAPAAPRTVKKTVCERVVVEETTGSRLGSAPKRCRTIEVPAPAGGANKSSERG